MSFFYIFLIIAYTGVEGNNNYTELYSKLLNGHNNLVPPNTVNINVSATMILVNIMEIDARNEEMTFSAILNLYWKDSTLSWSQKEFPLINQVSVPSGKIWTPNINIWNLAFGSKNIERDSGDVFISPNGQVHWSIFGKFKTFCTIDVTYYPFDQQTCIVKIGPIDTSIQMELKNENKVDLSQWYLSVYWTIIEAPAYCNIYKSLNDELPAETDIIYYFILRRNTHWLSEVYPLLAFAFLTILPAAVTRTLEKLIFQIFCIAGLFALYMNIMTKLPPTSFVTPLVSKYVLALILFNLMHLTLSTIINNFPMEYFDWIVHQTPKISKYAERKKSGKEGEALQHENGDSDDNVTTIENNGDLLNLTERLVNARGDKIVAICNKIILILLIFAVVISTICFLFGYPTD